MNTTNHEGDRSRPSAVASPGPVSRLHVRWRQGQWSIESELHIPSMTLARDEHGEYRGIYTDTPVAGPYQFSAEVSATSPAGHRVTRFRHMTGLSFDPRTGPGGSGGGTTQEPCREIQELIRRLGVVLERCCCKERHTA